MVWQYQYQIPNTETDTKYRYRTDLLNTLASIPYHYIGHIVQNGIECWKFQNWYQMASRLCSSGLQLIPGSFKHGCLRAKQSTWFGRLYLLDFKWALAMSFTTIWLFTIATLIIHILGCKNGCFSQDSPFTIVTTHGQF